MNATPFECRHPTVVHQLVVGAAFLTYLLDRDDIVWRFVKGSASPHTLERVVFIIATLFIAAGTAACTWARAHPTRRARYLGDLSYAVGLASLVPLAGFVLLVAGEALRVLRLSRCPRDPAHTQQSYPLRRAFRREAVKWGVLISMIVFVITLQDRHADILLGSSFLIGNLINVRSFTRSRADQAG